MTGKLRGLMISWFAKTPPWTSDWARTDRGARTLNPNDILNLSVFLQGGKLAGNLLAEGFQLFACLNK